jgi:pimeloyl-ACP methyl ester carboxylesterase
MPRFTSYDDTELAYHLVGEGEPLICLPGGSGRASSYLGDLGGLSGHRRLVLLDNRGTGGSDRPADPATYRRDRLAEDVEALRLHLGLERIDLLGHSAGAGIAMEYAIDYPDRMRRLVLLTPALRTVGLTPTVQEWDAFLDARRGLPWLAAAEAAMAALGEGDTTVATRIAAAPLFYGRWDETARAHAAAEVHEWSLEAAQGYNAEGAFVPGVTRRALQELTVPVLVYAAGADPISPAEHCRELAGLIPGSTFVVQPDGGHYPWLDEAKWVVEHVSAFVA